MSKNYNTRTASLKATIADIRNLDAKQINLDGKNILDYISDSEFNSYDTRDPELKNDELDIWNTEISLSDNNHIEVKPFEHGISYSLDTEEISSLEGVTESQYNTLRTAVKVIDDEVLGENDEHIMYWQTDGLKYGDGIFSYQSNLTTFTSDLSSLTGGESMFDNSSELTTFTSDLSSLEDGEYMFSSCSNLNFNSFTSDLSSLELGEGMFGGCENLTSFSSDLSKLMYGTSMFEGCSALTSFTSDLSSLIEGPIMFNMCTKLTSFFSDLSSLTLGIGMFSGCSLDAQSVANIIHTLPQRDYMPDEPEDEAILEYYIGYITIGLGCDDTEADQLLFAQECDCETWQELLDDFSAKNWTVTFQYNGRPTTTYNMRRGGTLPIYTKLVEVIMPTDENEHKPHYAYTSQDGSKFYNINYFHSTNGSTEGYDVFSSLEEAISTYNVTLKN